MPKRIIIYSRSEPARTIVFLVAVLTLTFQSLVLTPFVSPAPWLQLPNVLFIAAFCLWTIWSAYYNNIKQLSLSSFWLSMVWFWTGATRLMFSPDASMLLWSPFFVVSAALGVCYIYLSNQRRLLK